MCKFMAQNIFLDDTRQVEEIGMETDGIGFDDAMGDFRPAQCLCGADKDIEFRGRAYNAPCSMHQVSKFLETPEIIIHNSALFNGVFAICQFKTQACSRPVLVFSAVFLAHVARLQELDTKGIPPTSQCAAGCEQTAC